MGTALPLLADQMIAEERPVRRQASTPTEHPLDWRKAGENWSEVRTRAMRALMAEMEALSPANPGWSAIWWEDLWGERALASGADTDTFVLRYSQEIAPSVTPMVHVCSTEVQRGELRVAAYPGLLKDAGGRWTFGCHWSPRTEYDGTGAFGRLWRMGARWVQPAMEFEGGFLASGRPESAVRVLKADLLDEAPSCRRLLAAWCFWDPLTGGNELVRELRGDRPPIPEATLQKIGGQHSGSWLGWAYREAIRRRWVELPDDLPFPEMEATKTAAPPKPQSLFA